MSARCRCWCGCERLDRDLSDDTSSDLTCMPCIRDRHRRDGPDLSERIEALEGRVAALERNRLTCRPAGALLGRRRGGKAPQQEIRMLSVGDTVIITNPTSGFFGRGGTIGEVAGENVRVAFDGTGMGFGESEVDRIGGSRATIADIVSTLRKTHSTPYHLSAAKECLVCAAIQRAEAVLA